jgi:hypothetical protein
MPPDPARRLRPRMTLRQYGVLIVFVAIALAVLTPIGRSAWGFWDFAMLGAVELPYALLLPILVLVRRGPIKDWIVSAFCAVPIVAFLIYINFVAVTGQIAPMAFIHNHHVTPLLVVVAFADFVLLPLLARLVRRVIPGSCPNCGRRAMLRDPSVPRSRDFPRPGDARACLACGSRFRRQRRGPWFDVDDLDGRSSGPAFSPTQTLKDNAR